MRLKSFYAKTMSEAMQMVRDTLGENAVIVATREERGGGAVHVTAAVEPAFELGNNGMSAAAAEDWLQYDDEEDENAIAEELTDVLLRHGAPEDVMDNILSCATVVGLEDPSAAMIAAIEHLFTFRPLPSTFTEKPLMMVGAPGSGKTLAAAKIAARGVMNGLKIGVISCDTVRAGGIEQLESFTKLLRINLRRAGSPAELKTLVREMRGYDQIVIDTPSTNPFDQDSIKELAKLIGAVEAEPYMVLAAGGDAEETGEIARIFSDLGVHHLLPTRIDVARRLGSLLSAAHQGNLTFADAGDTPKVADGLIELSPRSLTGLLMPSIALQSRARKTGTGH